MKLLFILDPYHRLNIKKDTSVAMMQAASARGHALYVCQQHDLFLDNAVVKMHTQGFQLTDEKEWFRLSESETSLPSEFDAILMRKDPPFDNEYLYSTYLLELAANQGGCVVNQPDSVRSWNEKLSIARFPTLCPHFLVSNKAAQIKAFLAEHKDIVVKPLDGMGGAGIFRLTESDPNLNVILETATNHGKTTIMAQVYLPEIKQGDKRIIVINGKPIHYALARIPQAGETRGNLAAGGKGVAQPLSTRDAEIATTIGKTLANEGLFFVGLDVIGDYVTEINVTSPTGIVEIAAQTDCKPAEIFMDALEAKVSSKN